MEGPKKIIAILDGEKGIVEVNLREPRHRAEDDIFYTGLGGRSHRDGVAIAARDQQ